MGTIELRNAGITHLGTEAVVNAANEGLWMGGGVCGAIFNAAGPDELEAACRRRTGDRLPEDRLLQNRLRCHHAGFRSLRLDHPCGRTAMAGRKQR